MTFLSPLCYWVNSSTTGPPCHLRKPKRWMLRSIFVPLSCFFSALTMGFFHNSHISLGDLSQSRGHVAKSLVNRLCFSIFLSEIKLCTEINGLKLVLFVRLTTGMKSVPFSCFAKVDEAAQVRYEGRQRIWLTVLFIRTDQLSRLGR